MELGGNTAARFITTHVTLAVGVNVNRDFIVRGQLPHDADTPSY